jgi:hypothetical protein
MRLGFHPQFSQKKAQKRASGARRQKFMLIILATQEEEIRRIKVGSQPQQNSS